MTKPNRISTPISNRGAYKPRGAGTLKQAVTELVEVLGGGARAAEFVRVSATQMARYGDPAEADTHMPADIVHTLEAAAGVQPVTSWLAAESGFALLYAGPDGPHDAAGHDIWQLTPDTLRQASEMIAKTIEAEADGTVTPAEAGQVVREIDKLLARLMPLRSTFQSIRDEGQ